MNYNQTGSKPIVSMKWVIALTLLLAVLLGVAVSSNAQTAPKKADKVLRDTLVKGVKTQIFVGSRGGKYILVTPASGKTYKKYLKK